MRRHDIKSMCPWDVARSSKRNRGEFNQDATLIGADPATQAVLLFAKSMIYSSEPLSSMGTNASTMRPAV